MRRTRQVPPGFCPRGCKGRSPRRHLFAPPRGRGPSQTPPSRATDSSISPGSPLSLAAGTVQRKAFLAILAANRGLPFAPGSCLERFVNAANGLMQGCRGRSPRRNKLLISPFPGGEGGWGGWGQERKLTAGLAGDQKGKPPCGFRNGNVSRRPAGQAPQRAPTPQVQPVPLPAQARGCKGRSPRRHRLDLPRGRGPSQTPPSLATDSSISPGPPSPWLPTLLNGKRFLPFLRRTIGSAPGMQGAEPLA